MSDCTTHHHACECRESKIAELVRALEFYADKDNWDDDFTPTVWDDGQVDLGDRARAALEKWRGK